VTTAPEASPSVGSVPSRRRWLTLATVALAQLMVVLDATVVNIALPAAQAELGFSDGERQWVITAYALAFGSLLLLGGRLGDLVGRKRMFIIGLIGFAAASLFGGLAPTFELLVAARALQGVFGAVLAPTALAVLTTTFTIPKERGRAFGVFGAIAGAGGAIGLLLGGFLTEYFDWRWNLTINVFIAAIAVVGAIMFVTSALPTKPRPRLDPPGVVLVTLGLFGLVFGFSRAETEGWDSPQAWGSLVVAGALLVAFVLWQRRAAHPLLPLGVVLDRDRGTAYAAVFIAGAGMFGIFLFVTYYLQTVLQFSPMQTGIGYLPMIVMLITTAQLTTNLFLPRFGAKAIVPIGMTIGAGAMVGLTTLGIDSSYLHVAVILAFLGIAMGSIMPSSIQTATLGIEPRYAGVGSAFVNTSQQVGGAISTALLNTLATTATTAWIADNVDAGPAGQAEGVVAGFHVAWWATAGLFAFGAIVTAIGFRRRRDSRYGKSQDAEIAPHVG
jgi:EmrB/QacA subfamily drug resistance transporter